jgi:hypothetical protein
MLASGAEVVTMTGLSNHQSFGTSNSSDARPIPDWSPRSVPPWKFGLRLSDDRGGL